MNNIPNPMLYRSAICHKNSRQANKLAGAEIYIFGAVGSFWIHILVEQNAKFIRPSMPELR